MGRGSCGGGGGGADLWDIPDLVFACFSKLDVKSLCSASAVCKQWRAYAAAEDIWQAKVEDMWGPCPPLSLPEARARRGPGQWKRLLRCALSDFQLPSPPLMALAADGAAWSSQLHGTSIDSTLTDDLFWSSQPQEDPEVGAEFLTFRLRQPLCVVHGVEVLSAPLWRSSTPRYLRVDVGFEEGAFEYASAEEAMADAPSAAHRLLLPRDRLVVGDHVRVRFRGMHQPMGEPRAPGGAPRSIAIQRVRIFGVPIAAVLDNLMAEALVCHALRHHGFRASVLRLLKPPVGEELQVEEIVSGLRAALSRDRAFWECEEYRCKSSPVYAGTAAV